MLTKEILLVVLGLALIVAGGNLVTDGAVGIARRFGISPLVIGLTVVAFGSSTPDFVVCLISTLQGKSEMAVGEVIGSGIFDTLMVAGMVAVITPVSFTRDAWRFDLPMLLLASFALFIVGDHVLLDGAKENVISRADGLLLLMSFAFFMYKVLDNAKRNPMPEPKARVKRKPMNLWLAGGMVVAGLVCLVFGGDWLVDGASGIARKCGMSEAMVGLTIVGIGSGIPDLASSAIAAIKKQPGLALGNIVGACIFNSLFIIGACATIHPLTANNMTTVDFATMLGSSALLVLFGTASRRHRITRLEGVIMMLCYVAYITYLILSSRS